MPKTPSCGKGNNNFDCKTGGDCGGRARACPKGVTVNNGKNAVRTDERRGRVVSSRANQVPARRVHQPSTARNDRSFLISSNLESRSKDCSKMGLLRSSIGWTSAGGGPLLHPPRIGGCAQQSRGACSVRQQWPARLACSPLSVP